MWIFGYGSLMGDGWEEKFRCIRKSIATLQGYRRAFNKVSTKNWGTQRHPGPTLNLEKAEGCACRGIAFEFPDDQSGDVRKYLSAREGKDFPLEILPIRLEDETNVLAEVPVYRGKNLMSSMTTQARAAMVRTAAGANGSCTDYVKRTAELLAKLGIEDPVVSELWESVQIDFIQSLMSEIRERLDLLESNLPQHADGFAISPHSKLPFKILLYREVLAWRMAELSSCAFENLRKEKLSSGVTLVRAAVETSAALWYLLTKVESALGANSTGEIDDYMMKLLMGSKTDQTLPQPINVLTFVDRANKEVEGFRHQYDVLSEFAHPNWAGTSLLYSKSDPKNLCTDFGANLRGELSTKQVGVVNLSVGLMIFERNYNLVSDLMPSFVELCERTVKTVNDNC